MFAEINGACVFYTLRGEGERRAVLLHGWGCHSGLMENLAAALEKDMRILCIDFPGFGQSSKPPAPWGVPEYAEMLRALLEKESFLPCAAVGHSFGCRVIAWAASEWPQLFTRLILTGAAGLKAPPTEEGKKRAAEYQKKKQLALKVERIPFLHGLGQRMAEKYRQQYGSRDYNALDPDMRQTFVKVVNLDLRDRYPRIRQSTLLIWGDQDTETPLWMGQEMEKLIPDAGLVTLEGGSHFAYLEQGPRFALIARHFLTED